MVLYHWATFARVSPGNWAWTNNLLRVKQTLYQLSYTWLDIYWIRTNVNEFAIRSVSSPPRCHSSRVGVEPTTTRLESVVLPLHYRLFYIRGEVGLEPTIHLYPNMKLSSIILGIRFKLLFQCHCSHSPP